VGGDDIVIIAGPCSVESEEQILSAAHAVRNAGATALRGGAFKPRSSPYAFQGLGVEGLKLLAKARQETGLAIVTEAMDEHGADLVAEYADCIQIGARNMQNYSLLRHVGKIGKPVMLKRGMAATINDLLLSAEYILAEGNPNVILCERGVRTFDPATRNLFDLTAIPVVHKLSHLPIVADPSHGTGLRDKVTPMARALGVDDAWPVVTEPFCQWVIEDRFVGERPAWEAAGATLVATIEPFEHMKLRLLNGAHSALAYLAVGAGVETVADAMALPGMRGFLRALWAEAGATLELPAGYDLEGYVAALERRFENRALRHRTRQIAMDGSQKLPQRLLAPIRERLAAGASIAALAAAVAAWMRHVRGRGEAGETIPLDDPLAGDLRRAVARDSASPVRGLVAIDAIFGDLGQDERFVEAVAQALAALDEAGARGFLARYVQP
jgi:3-deoxy-7-phosphoheptulonate synthase